MAAPASVPDIMIVGWTLILILYFSFFKRPKKSRFLTILKQLNTADDDNDEDDGGKYLLVTFIFI